MPDGTKPFTSNQCWLIISGVLWHPHRDVFRGNAHDIDLLTWIWILLMFIQLHLPGVNELTHWGRVTHICIGELTIIVSDNGLSPGRRQAIIWTNAGILLIGPYGTNFSEILIEILTFSFTKMSLKVSSAKWRPSCLGLNVLNTQCVRKFRCWTPNVFFVYSLSFSTHINSISLKITPLAIMQLPLCQWSNPEKYGESLQIWKNYSYKNKSISLMKMFEFWLKFHWSLFLRVQLTVF